MFSKTLLVGLLSALVLGQRFVPDKPEEEQEEVQPSKWDDDWSKDHEGEIIHWDEIAKEDDFQAEDWEEQQWEEIKEEEEEEEEFINSDGKPDKCYGIALADSTDFGPYQAGALIGLLKHQNRTKEAYQVITGMALGALNAYIMSIYEAAEISQVEQELSKLHSHS